MNEGVTRPDAFGRRKRLQSQLETIRWRLTGENRRRPIHTRDVKERKAGEGQPLSQLRRPTVNRQVRSTVQNDQRAGTHRDLTGHQDEPRSDDDAGGRHDMRFRYNVDDRNEPGRWRRR
jgi:hypothetical protein